MFRDLDRLRAETFDLGIIGGGIYGLTLAWNAALLGMKVALVEKGDFGSGTSSGSYRIIHGGLRYLQHLDFKRMRESIRERRFFLRAAPHLVEPLGFLVPTYPGLMKSKTAMRLALAANDCISADRNKGVRESRRILPGGKILSRKNVLERCPLLTDSAPTGGALFYDAKMRSAERMNITFALTAAREGALLAHYVKAESLVGSDDEVTALRVRDLESGNVFDVRTRFVVNAAGPWVPDVGRKGPQGDGGWAAGIQLVTEPPFPLETGFAFTTKRKDPNAQFERGGMHLFVVPHQGKAVWGTSETYYRGPADAWKIREEDVVNFLDEINQAHPGLGLTRKDVLHAYGGLRLIRPGSEAGVPNVARKHGFVDHHWAGGPSNLFSLIGVKYTVARAVTQEIAKAVSQRLSLTLPSVAKASDFLVGGAYANRDELVETCRKACAALPEADLQLSIDWLGTEALTLMKRIEAPFDSDAWLTALVRYSVEVEGALHLDDFLRRRTAWCDCGRPPESLVQRCAERMGALLYWSDDEVQEEIQKLQESFDFTP